MRNIIGILMMTALLAACTPSVENPTMVDRQPSIYPDYAGVTIPVDIALSTSI